MLNLPVGFSTNKPNFRFRPTIRTGPHLTTPTGIQQATPTTRSNFRLCTSDQQVDYSLIDDACHEIKNLCLQHIVSDNDRQHFIHELDSYCLHRKNLYVEKMKIYCNDFNAEDPWVFVLYGRMYYEFGKQFFNETQQQMTYQLMSVNMNTLTDGDIDMSNQIIPDSHSNLYHHLAIIPANNRTVHVHISNNTFHKVYFHLDNSKISAHITNNVFTGSGIKILSTSTNLNQPVIIENSIFQGLYSKTTFEVLNTNNVYLYSCVFNNSKLAVPKGEDESSGMWCLNSKIVLNDTFFREVSFFPVAAFENCTLAIFQLTMSGNYLSLPRSETNSLMHLKYSEAIIEDGKIENSTRVHCFSVLGGNTTLHNILFGSNNEVEFGRFVDATVNITNTSVVNNIDSTFHISKSTVYFSSCTFLNISIPSRHYLMDTKLLSIQGSHVSIVHCIFNELEAEVFILSSELFIRGSHFLQIKNSFHFIRFAGSPESLLYISHCRFESNELTEAEFSELHLSLFDVGLGSTVIQDTVFYHNRIATLVFGKSIKLTNCIFSSNLASQVVFSMNDGTVQFSNCSFSNNVFSNNTRAISLGLVEVNSGHLTISNCMFTNNSSPYGLGVIFPGNTAASYWSKIQFL